MRQVAIVVCMVGMIGCKRTIPGHRVAKLDFVGCTIEVPTGLNVADSTMANSPPGAQVLVLDHSFDGFAPSIVIQELAMPLGDHKDLHDATTEWCRDAYQKPTAATTGTDPGPVKVAVYGAFHGCDIQVSSPTTNQSARQIAVSNGKLAVSILCNRDKQGASEVDAACEGLARAITPK